MDFGFGAQFLDGCNVMPSGKRHFLFRSWLCPLRSGLEIMRNHSSDSSWFSVSFSKVVFFFYWY